MDLGLLDTTLKATLELNKRFYAALLELSTNYWTSVGQILGNATMGGSASPAPEASPAPAQAMTPPLLLAARAGEKAGAAFVVDNKLKQAVTARVEARGDEMAARAVVLPKTVVLQPGEECVVQVSIAIDDSFEVAKDYHGECNIPDLTSRAIPFVVRRLLDQAEEAF